MTIMVWLFGAVAAAELAMHYVPLLWRARRLLSPGILVLNAFATGAVVMWRLNVFSVLILVIGLYRLLNSLRVIEHRMHEAYLRRATRRTSLALLGLQALVAVAWLAWAAWHTTGAVTWAGVATAQLALAAVLLASTVRRLRRTAWLGTTAHCNDEQLPTLTVAIPARNETEDLQECLHSLIASDYPKLEVLVLDDCSQTKRTPEIIRSFAHDGVRFIQGEDPQGTWLPKNQAYDRLAQQASGAYILFCGVDVRFAPASLRQLVTLMLAKNKQMVSVLPYRSQTARGFALAQAMRYWWELVPPRRLFRRPPVLSTLWIVTAESLRGSGGFAAVARAIVPEAFFARRLVATDAYSFLRADVSSGIQSAKSANDQRETAVRTRYPQLHRRPENVCALAAGEALLFILPFVLAVGGFWLPVGWLAQLLAAGAAVLLTITYELLVLSTRTGSWWSGLMGALAGPVYDIGLMQYSMWQYEFSVVNWKGRNVCIPAMHVIPHLPKLS